MSDERQAPVDESETTETPEVELESEASAESTVDAIQQELESLNAELSEAKDQAIRAQAELQNVRRRAEQDVEKAHKFGQEKLLSDLLPVVDNLERAIEAIDSNDDSLKSVVEGIELTLKSFTDTLERYQVVAVNPEGEPFDPQLHQAMSMIENPDVEPNTVINVFQKGYTLNGRLVRPAMVVVAKS